MNIADDSTKFTASAAGDGASSAKVRTTLELLDATGRLGRDDLDWIAQHGVRALEIAMGDSPVGGHVRVRFVDDAEMSAAHVEYLEIEGTTDVLTFDMSDEDGLDVDVLACVDEADRRGRELGHDRRRELLLYIVHGALHCLGHDDHDEDAARRMHDREDEILRLIGVGGVFAPERLGGSS